MKRKGSAIIMVITIFAIVIPLSIFVSAINASNVLEESVELRSGDVEVLAESQVQKENLRDQYRAGLNYSLNEEAFQMGESKTWTDSTPSISSIESSFVKGSQEKLNERFTDLSFSCEVEEMNVRAEDIDAGEYTVETDGNKVECSRLGVSVTNYFTSSLEVVHPDNRFVALADYAIRASENFDDRISGETVEGEGSESGSCGESESSVKSDAKEDAKDDATSGRSYGSDAVSDTEDVEGTSIDESTSYSGSGTIDDTRSSRCCLETEMVTNEDGTTEPECVDHDTEYDADASWTASQARFDISITDQENELAYSEGVENLVYNAEYVYSFD